MVGPSFYPILYHSPRSEREKAQTSTLDCGPVFPGVFGPRLPAFLGMRARAWLEGHAKPTMHTQQAGRDLSARLYVTITYYNVHDRLANEILPHVADVIADLILIIAPLKLLSGLEDKGLRHRLMVIFSTCIVTTIVSLVHAVYILKLGGTKVVVAALVEVRQADPAPRLPTESYSM